MAFNQQRKDNLGAAIRVERLTLSDQATDAGTKETPTLC